MSLARAESVLCEASARGELDSADHAAVAAQIRLGVHYLGAMLHASVLADTMLAAPFATARPSEPEPRGWQYKVLRITGVISALAGIGHLIASFSGASPGTRSMFGYVGGSAAGVSGVVNRWMARPRPERATVDPGHTSDLAADLRTTVRETELAAALQWEDLSGMGLDSSATIGPQVVVLARRYVNALEATSTIIDSRLVTSLAIARSCAQDPELAAESRDRSAALASHLDAVCVSWQNRRWLFERSKTNTLDYLVLADRP